MKLKPARAFPELHLSPFTFHTLPFPMKALPWYKRRNRREPLKYTALTDRLYRYVAQCRSGADDAVLDELRAETRRRFPEAAPMLSLIHI